MPREIEGRLGGEFEHVEADVEQGVAVSAAMIRHRERMHAPVEIIAEYREL